MGGRSGGGGDSILLLSACPYPVHGNRASFPTLSAQKKLAITSKTDRPSRGRLSKSGRIPRLPRNKRRISVLFFFGYSSLQSFEEEARYSKERGPAPSLSFDPSEYAEKFRRRELFGDLGAAHRERERGTCARMFRFHTRFSPPIKSPLPPSLDRESTELLKGVFSAFLFLLSCFGLVLREGGSVERAKKGDSPSTPPLPRRPNPRTHPPFFPCPDSDISFLLRQGTSGSDETWAEAEESLNFPFFLPFLPFSRPRSPTHTFSAAKYSTFLAPFSKAPPPAPVILGVWPRASLGRPLVALAGWGRCWPFAYNGKRREENAASAADAGKKGVFKEKKAGLRYFLKNCTQRFLRKVNFCRDAEVQAPF